MGSVHSRASVAFACLTAPVASEEQSILAGCQMSQFNILPWNNFNSNAICDGGFKSMAFFQNNMADGSTYNKEVVIILTQSKTIVSSFVLNVSYWAPPSLPQDRMGTSALYVGNDSTAFSTSLTKVTADMFDGGFFKLSPPTAGKYVVLRRTSLRAGLWREYSINEIRLYQTQNLLLERSGQLTISAPASTDQLKWPATNLITNLGNRSSGNDLYPIMDASGTRASYQSCYKTSNIQLSAEGHILKVSLNLGEVLFVHSVLIVQDLLYDWAVTTSNDPKKFLQNFEIYVGLNADHTLNPRCGGGPFMRVENPLNYVNVSYLDRGGYTGPMWKFGHEAWCNMEGQYLVIVADLKHYAGQAYLMSICQLGAFGTKYVRLTPVPSTLWILQGTTLTLNVENIAADASLPIGNTLDIMVRQRSGTEQAWVTITQGNPTVVSFAPASNLAIGQYSVILESYDNNGGVFSTLKSDTVTVRVLPAECGRALIWSSAFETTQPIMVVREYGLTIYYPETLFTGPHTFTSYACGGIYTQSISIDPPVAGVVLTDKPTGPDLRPLIEISPSAPTGASFSLKFTGRYVYAPTSTDITASFTQTFLIKTVFSTDYLEQPTITHSLTTSQLTFSVPPAATGSIPPTHALTANEFSVAFPIKQGMTDALGNTPPAITPSPYAGFTSSQIVQGQSSLGSTSLASPPGSLQLQSGPGSGGNLNPGSTVTFTCDDWTSSIARTTHSKTLTFTNTVDTNFKASIQVKCAYGVSNPPTFQKDLETTELVASVPTQWELPTILAGSLSLAKVKFEPDEALFGLFSFNEPTRTVSFRGTELQGDLCGKQFRAKVTLTNVIGQESRYDQVIAFATCPVPNPALQPQNLAQSLTRREPISIEKLESSYAIVPNTTSTNTFNFVDPLARANDQGSVQTEVLQLKGIEIKVIENQLPSVIRVTQITYERLGFGSIELTADGDVAQALLDKQKAKNVSQQFLEGYVVIEVTDLSPEGKKSLFTISYKFKPSEDDRPTPASHKDAETKAELVDDITKNKLELLKETIPQTQKNNPPQAKIEYISRSGELQILFSNQMVIPNAETLKNNTHVRSLTDGTQDRVPNLFLQLLNDKKILSINYERDGEVGSVELQWQITVITAIAMEVRLLFDEPFRVSTEGLDRISVTFNTQGLLFDRFGSEIELGFTTNKSRVPRQYGSESDAKFWKEVVIIGQPIEINAPNTKFLLNTLVAAGLQQVLSAIPSSQIIVLIPYFDVFMPADVETLFNILLQISAFEAIPTDYLFVEMEASLLNVTIDPKAERFEDLGFSGTWMLINLGSTLVIFSLISAASLVLCCVPKRSERCPKLTRCARKCRDPLKFGYPLQQFKESYVIIVTASLLNITFVSWSDAKDAPAAQINLVLSYVLLGLAAVFPAAQQLFLFCNRHKLRRATFRQKFGTTYENLRLSGTKYVLHPLFFYYRRLSLPIAIICFRATLIVQFVIFNLGGIASFALLFVQKPFEQGNAWEVCEELSLLVISYHILCFTPSVPNQSALQSYGTSLLTCMTLQLLVFLLASGVAWFHSKRRSCKIWMAQRAVQRSIEARARAREQRESNSVSRCAQSRTLNEAVEQAQEASQASLGTSSSSSNNNGSGPGESSLACDVQSLSVIEEEEEKSFESSRIVVEEESKQLSLDLCSITSNSPRRALKEEEKVHIDIMSQSYFDHSKAQFGSRLVDSKKNVIQSLYCARPQSPVGVFAQVDMVRDSELLELGMNGVYDDDLSSAGDCSPHTTSQFQDQSQFGTLHTPNDQDSQELMDNESALDVELVHIQTINLPKGSLRAGIENKVASIFEEPVQTPWENRRQVPNKQKFFLMTRGLLNAD